MIDIRAIFIWPVLMAQSLIFGTAIFALIFAPNGESATPSDALIGMWRGLAILNLVMSVLAFMAIASGMAQMPWANVLPLIPQIMRETVAGRFWMWRLVAALLLAIAMWIPVRTARLAVAAMVLAMLLVLLGSLTSHAIDKGAWVISIYAIHQAAAGMWLGALASLLMSARRGAAALEAVTPRVSTVCAWALAIIVTSGPLIAFQWLRWNLHLLIDSAYGRTLVWKLATAVPALLLGASNRYWQVPRVAQQSVRTLLIRSVAAETALLLAVLGWSAFLANTPPPH
ncbi:MAG TPA: CopD family protein [Candidatus Binataceae bacterium]|nr:CopD family protein [Candidatus Binataceae bacterium]